MPTLIILWTLVVVVYPSLVVWLAVSLCRRMKREGKALLSLLLPLLVVIAGASTGIVVAQGVAVQLERSLSAGK